MHGLIGQKLRAAREKRGLTLSDVAHATRIPESRLILLEQDNFAAFGSMTYARMFLKAYSKYLGIDASEAIEALAPGRTAFGQLSRRGAAFYGKWSFQRRAEAAGQAAYASVRSASLAMLLLIVIVCGLWVNHLSARRTDLPDASEAVPAATSEPPSSTAASFPDRSAAFPAQVKMPWRTDPREPVLAEESP